MTVLGHDFECLSDNDGQKHIDIRRFRSEKPSVVESCTQSWSYQTGQYLHFEPGQMTRSSHHQCIGMQYEH